MWLSLLIWSCEKVLIVEQGNFCLLLPGFTAKLVSCLTVDPGVASSNSSLGTYLFLEADHEIISTVILPLPLIQEGLLSVTDESMCINID